MRPAGILIAVSVTAALAFAIGHSLGSRSRPGSRLKEPIAEAGSSLARILTIPDSRERTRLLMATFEELSAADLPEVRATFEQSMVFVDPIAIVLLAEWWARQDPRWALAASNTWPLSDPALGFETVLRTWAQRDPLAARLALDEIENPERRDAAIAAVARGWVDSGDVEGVAGFLEGIPDSGARQRAIGYLASALVARRGMGATESFAEAVPDDAQNRFKLQLFRRVATALTQLDPARGAAWAQRHMDGSFGDTLVRRVAVSWVRQDPEAMLAWLQTLPEGKKRDVGLREGYRQWMMLDRQAALDWFRRVELGPALEPAMELYAIATGREDPNDALAWAARIENEELRERATVVVARRWMQRDAEAAREWLESASLPEPWRERIETESKRPGRPAPDKG